MGNVKSNKINKLESGDDYLNRRATSVRHNQNHKIKYNDGISSTDETENGLKRTNSLPTKRKPPLSYDSGETKPVLNNKIRNKNEKRSESARDSMVKPIPLQGFDLVRHHFGQADCDNSNLNELEASVQLLNEKLLDLDQCRLECLRKFSQINEKLQNVENQPKLSKQNPVENNRQSSSFAVELRMRIIEKYLYRIENLFNVNGEPFLLNANNRNNGNSNNSNNEEPIKSTKLEKNFKSSSTRESTESDELNIVQLKQLRKSLKHRHKPPRLLPSVSMSSSMPSLVPNNSNNTTSTDQTTTTTDAVDSSTNHHHHQSPSCRSKRQAIKDAYTHLIRSIMPKLYGNRTFEHRDDPQYRQFWQNLATLRDRISIEINITEEQQLIDAKRIFLQEINGYLMTLEQMVTCQRTDCAQCCIK